MSRLLLLALLGLAACGEATPRKPEPLLYPPDWPLTRYVDTTLMVACYRHLVDGLSCVRIDHLPPTEKP